MTKTNDLKARLERLYGRFPNAPIHLSVVEIANESYAAGKATLRRLRADCQFNERSVSFDFYEMMPTQRQSNIPCVIFLSEERAIPNRFLPAEEIIDEGIGLLVIFADDLTRPSADSKKSIFDLLCGSRRRADSPGKLAVIAWAAGRIAEYAYGIGKIDKKKISVAGHGVLGRAALLSVAHNEKITAAFANDSISLGTEKAPLEAALSDPYLFAPRAYPDEDIVADQELLLKLCSPKPILIGTANSDPASLPQKEREAIDRLLSSGESEDRFSFYVRDGQSYMSRDDWKEFFRFIRGI